MEVDLYRYRISVDTAMKFGSGTTVVPLFRLTGALCHAGSVRSLQVTGRPNVSERDLGWWGW